ncbi:MAG TPA: tetratricopeptide repeat protein [Chitinophagaceae bacterium]|nr:tetratricopeptide repeat protein [Chitinophagaceae bacterium]
MRKYLHRAFFKRKVILPVLCMMGTLHLYAQNTAPGDLSTEMLKANQPDSTQVIKLLSHGIKMESVNLDSALAIYRRATRISEEIPYPTGIAKGFQYAGIVYADMGKYDSSMRNYETAIGIYSRIGDRSGMGACYLNIANLYQFRGNYEKGMQFYFKAIKTFSPDDLPKLSVAYSNLGVIFQKLGQYEKAADYYNRAVTLSRKSNDSGSLGNGLINLGAINEILNRDDEALRQFEEANSIGEHKKDLMMQRDALTDIGEIYFKNGKPGEGFAAVNEALKYADQLGYPYDIASILISLGEHSMDEGRLVTAEKYLDRALSLSKSIHSNTLLSKTYLDLSTLEFKQQHYKQAYVHQRKYKQYSDSVFNQEQVKAVNEIETKYQTAQKNKEIAEQNLTLEKNKEAIQRKNTWILLFVFGIVALAVILFLSLRSYRHKQSLHRQSLLTLQKEHEVNTLKTKMDAREEERNRIGREMHDDIGSALTTILYLSHDLKTQGVQKSRPTAERIADTAGSVVDKMNEIIWSMNREYDTLDDLIAYARQHAAEFLDNHGLEHHFETPDMIDDVHLTGEQRRNIYLVIKETLHNIVKHACATEVNIDFELDQKLTVVIHDNGKGIDLDKLRRFGNGLRSMKQRMESIGGSFTISGYNGTTVRLTCPLERKAADAVMM